MSPEAAINEATPRKLARLWANVFLSTAHADDWPNKRRALVFLHQISWGALNTVVGVVCGSLCIVLLREARVLRWKTVSVVHLPGRRFGAVTLGPVVVAGGPVDADLLDHEKGHWYQSIALGPLYFLIIGLPSITHAAWYARHRSFGPAYFHFYTEAWADAWGGVWHRHQHSVGHWSAYLLPRALRGTHRIN